MMPNSVYLTPREEKWPRMTFPNRKIPHESDEFIGSTILDTKAANDNGGQVLTQLHGLGCCRLAVRSISTTHVCEKNLRAGQYKITNNRSKPLTYEQAQQPYKINVTKSWNSWNTSNLQDEKERTSETTVEDVFIRKFMLGTWHNLLLSETIIKRRHNLIIIAGLVYRGIAPRKMYFLQGYTEELLSCLLKRPVKVEIQAVESRKDMIFKWI